MSTQPYYRATFQQLLRALADLDSSMRSLDLPQETQAQITMTDNTVFASDPASVLERKAEVIDGLLKVLRDVPLIERRGKDAVQRDIEAMESIQVESGEVELAENMIKHLHNDLEERNSRLSQVVDEMTFATKNTGDDDGPAAATLDTLFRRLKVDFNNILEKQCPNIKDDILYILSVLEKNKSDGAWVKLTDVKFEAINVLHNLELIEHNADDKTLFKMTNLL